MVDGIGHPPTTTRNNTKTKTKKRCNNLHYTHLHCLHFYMYLGMTIVEQPTLLFCRHNKFCYDMKQTTLQSWSNLPTQSLMMESPLFSGSRTHLKFRRRMPCVCAGLKFVISANGKGCSYSISISKSISQDPICATLPSTTRAGCFHSPSQFSSWILRHRNFVGQLPCGTQPPSRCDRSDNDIRSTSVTPWIMRIL